MPSRIEGDRTYVGAVNFAGTVSLPANAIRGTSISTNAADRIPASTVVHQFALRYSQDGGGSVASATVPLHAALGDGEIIGVSVAVLAAAVGDSTVTVDLQRSAAGAAFASVLSAAIEIDNAVSVRTPVPGVVADEEYNADDVLQLVVTATAGTGTLPQGLVVTVFVAENPA